MARKRKSPRRLGGILALVAAAVLALAGFLLFNSSGPATHRTIPPLDVASYLENSNTLRGNIYKMEGTVAESLAWSPASGRLIAVEVGEDILPVLVTVDFNSMNIQKQQRLVFVVEVDEKGILRTREVTKA